MLTYIEQPTVEFKTFSVSEKRLIEWEELSNLPHAGDILAGRDDNYRVLYQGTDVEIDGLRVFTGDIIEFVDKGLLIHGIVKFAFGEVSVEFEDGDNYSYYRLDEVIEILEGSHLPIEDFMYGGVCEYEEEH